MKDLKIFINLTRLNKPIGYLLLFWPCSWGLAYAYSVNQNIDYTQLFTTTHLIILLISLVLGLILKTFKILTT